MSEEALRMIEALQGEVRELQNLHNETPVRFGMVSASSQRWGIIIETPSSENLKVKESDQAGNIIGTSENNTDSQNAQAEAAAPEILLEIKASDRDEDGGAVVQIAFLMPQLVTGRVVPFHETTDSALVCDLTLITPARFIKVVDVGDTAFTGLNCDSLGNVIQVKATLAGEETDPPEMDVQAMLTGGADAIEGTAPKVAVDDVIGWTVDATGRVITTQLYAGASTTRWGLVTEVDYDNDQIKVNESDTLGEVVQPEQPEVGPPEPPKELILDIVPIDSLDDLAIGIALLYATPAVQVDAVVPFTADFNGRLVAQITFTQTPLRLGRIISISDDNSAVQIIEVDDKNVQVALVDAEEVIDVKVIHPVGSRELEMLRPVLVAVTDTFTGGLKAGPFLIKWTQHPSWGPIVTETLVLGSIRVKLQSNMLSSPALCKLVDPSFGNEVGDAFMVHVPTNTQGTSLDGPFSGVKSIPGGTVLEATFQRHNFVNQKSVWVAIRSIAEDPEPTLVEIQAPPSPILDGIHRINPVKCKKWFATGVIGVGATDAGVLDVWVRTTNRPLIEGVLPEVSDLFNTLDDFGQIEPDASKHSSRYDTVFRENEIVEAVFHGAQGKWFFAVEAKGITPVPETDEICV